MTGLVMGVHCADFLQLLDDWLFQVTFPVRQNLYRAQKLIFMKSFCMNYELHTKNFIQHAAV